MTKRLSFSTRLLLRELYTSRFSCTLRGNDVSNFKHFSKSTAIACLNSDQRNQNKAISSHTHDSHGQSERLYNKYAPTLKDFLRFQQVNDGPTSVQDPVETVPYLHSSTTASKDTPRSVYIETYGCQMNVNDSEIALSILLQNGFVQTTDINQADVLFMMTCSIREGAEQKIWKRLNYFKTLKAKGKKKMYPVKIGILGCMAERLKTKLIDQEKAVDIVCGPDSYKDLPRLLDVTSTGQAAVNVQLSLDETYADVMPVRIDPQSPSAFVSIMRGCDNMCSYCIVPFTRGRERSRPIESIMEEVKTLSDQGIKQVTLLGQNVNSYLDRSQTISYGGFDQNRTTKLSAGFNTIYKTKTGGRRFSELLDKVSEVDPEMRIRFTSPHPKDFPDEVLHIMKDRPNICNCIHLPAQSGNSEVLQAMRRGYTREAYLDLVHHIRHILPDVGLTSDFIAGFCGETEEAHMDTLSLMEQVQYDYAFCFPYSMRQKTKAYHKLTDDVPESVKKRRHQELQDGFRMGSLRRKQAEIGQQQLVLVEKVSKRSDQDMVGRNDRNSRVIFRNTEIPTSMMSSDRRMVQPGNYVVVKITSCSSEVLHGTLLHHSKLQEFSRRQNSVVT